MFIPTDISVGCLVWCFGCAKFLLGDLQIFKPDRHQKIRSNFVVRLISFISYFIFFPSYEIRHLSKSIRWPSQKGSTLWIYIDFLEKNIRVIWLISVGFFDLNKKVNRNQQPNIHGSFSTANHRTTNLCVNYMQRLGAGVCLKNILSQQHAREIIVVVRFIFHSQYIHMCQFVSAWWTQISCKYVNSVYGI